jgi:hypothetical protein
VESARVAPSRPVREAPYRSRNGNKMVRSDKSHIVQHKTGREEDHGRPGSGEPRETPLPPFYDAQCVLILRAREHRPRRRAPVRPHSANWKKMGARMEEVCRFAGEHNAGECCGRFVHLPPRATVLDFPFTAKRESWRWCEGWNLAAVRVGLMRSARAGNGACRWRVTAPRSPRARGFGNGKFFERAGCGETRRCAPRKRQSRWRG